jgi:hypothetical protein
VRLGAAALVEFGALISAVCANGVESVPLRIDLPRALLRYVLSSSNVAMPPEASASHRQRQGRSIVRT